MSTGHQVSPFVFGYQGSFPRVSKNYLLLRKNLKKNLFYIGFIQNLFQRHMTCLIMLSTGIDTK